MNLWKASTPIRASYWTQRFPHPTRTKEPPFPTGSLGASLFVAMVALPLYHLILGTWQDSDDDTKENPSNVTLIYESIVKTADPTSIVNQLSGNHKVPRTFHELTDVHDKGCDQFTYYFPGVATHDNKFLHRLFCAASGAGLIEKVREAYATIVQNWRHGDEIYLFGFSRGAYTVRTVGGLIAEYGLLTPNAMSRFYELIHIYQATAVRSYSEKVDHTSPFEDSEWHSRDVSIKFIGVWDTVGSMGIPDMNLFGLRLNKVKEINFLHRFVKHFNRRYELPDKLVHRRVDFAFHAYLPPSFVS